MIVFSDLDGTFLTTSKQVSNVNIEALDALLEAGAEFVPCSGRALSGIDPCIVNHAATRFAITSNGAVVTDVQTGVALRREDLGLERALAYYELARDRDVTYDIFADGRIFTQRAIFDRLHDFVDDPDFFRSMYESRTPYDEDTPTFLRSLHHIERATIYWRDPADRDALTAALLSDPTISCVRSFPTNIEFSDASATKGAALTWLCEYLGIPLKDAIAFGDNINDLSMIEAAGTGIAMGNAEDTVKRAADDVAGTNDKGGVGEYLLQLLEARQ